MYLHKKKKINKNILFNIKIYNYINFILNTVLIIQKSSSFIYKKALTNFKYKGEWKNHISHNYLYIQ